MANYLISSKLFLFQAPKHDRLKRITLSLLPLPPSAQIAGKHHHKVYNLLSQSNPVPHEF